jgi:phosphosulfolactate phosphohydrolase-like enzyme
LQTDDVKFCLQQDTIKVVPEMLGEYLVNLTPQQAKSFS